MKSLFVLIIAITSPFVFANDGTYFNLEIMTSFISKMNDSSSTPLIRGIENDVLTIQNKKVPDVLMNFMNKLQFELFGESDRISLQYCLPSSGGVMTAMFVPKTICLRDEDIKKILTNKQYKRPYSFLKTLLAHELSHFVHEYSTHYMSPYGTSLNNSKSIYRQDFEWYYMQRFGSLDYSLASKEDFLKITDMMGFELSFAHAEVDIYAYILMQKVDEKIPYDDLEYFFQSQINSAEAGGVEDSKKRMQAMQFFKSENI